MDELYEERREVIQIALAALDGIHDPGDIDTKAWLAIGVLQDAAAALVAPSGGYPTTRHMSIQAWRRLNRTMSSGELKDLAADLAAVVGLTDTQQREIVFALTGFNWETRKQA